jgi:hypothetical protein
MLGLALGIGIESLIRNRPPSEHSYGIYERFQDWNGTLLFAFDWSGSPVVSNLAGSCHSIIRGPNT